MKSPASHSEAEIHAHWGRLMIGVLALALAARLLAAFALEDHVQGSQRQFFVEGDANGYWELGQKLARGEQYAIHHPPRYVLRTPGFPLFLAACNHLIGTEIIHARFCLAFVGTGCCWLVWLLGARLFTHRVGFWACVIVALNPLQVGNSVLILSETLFTFFMLATLLSQLSLHSAITRTGGGAESQFPVNLLLRSGMLGCLLACTTLVRPGFILWLPLSCVLVLLASPRDRPSADKDPTSHRVRRSLSTCGVLLAFFLTMLPWAWRNFETTGHVVFTSLWSGPSLYDGLNPEADGTSNMEFFDRDQVMTRQDMTENEMNEHYRDLAVQFVRKNPWRAVELGFLKAARYLAPSPAVLSRRYGVLSAACAAFYAVFVGLIVLGVWRGDGNRSLNPLGLALSLGPFLLFLLVHLVFVGSVRYRLPVEFPLSVLAGAGIRQLLTRNRSTAAPSETE